MQKKYIGNCTSLLISILYLMWDFEPQDLDHIDNYNLYKAESLYHNSVPRIHIISISEGRFSDIKLAESIVFIEVTTNPGEQVVMYNFTSVIDTYV